PDPGEPLEATRAEPGRPARPAAPPAPRRGDVLGRYVVLEALGRGGMGEVYAAYDPELDRRVAVKLLRTATGTAADQARLLREGQAMARLAHPNVVAVYDVGALHRRVFVAMELVAGGDLRAWLAAAPRSRAEILAVFAAAGRGLAAAHRAGLVHRDFKPENVLVADDGRVKVADFGLARTSSGATAEPPPSARDELAGGGLLATPLTRHGALLGTPGYLAPELFAGGGADARSDQFSFCVALWEALCGSRPFPGVRARELCAAMAAGAPPERAHSQALPPWLRRVLLRGLAVDPSARFPSMEALLAALAADPARRRQRWLRTAAAAVGVAGAITGVAAWQWQQGEVCQGAGERLLGAWDPARSHAVRSAFLATGEPYAAASWRAVQGTLDRFAASWAAMRTAACEATHVHGEQSADLLDRRVACLDQRRAELAALVEVFTTADRQVVEGAAQAAHALTPLESCADTAALLDAAPPPRDPAGRQQLARFQRRLGRSHALYTAGRYGAAAEAADAALATAAELDWGPAAAAAHNARGAAHMALGDGAVAEEALRAAAWAAIAGHDDRQAVQAVSNLVELLGHHQARPEASEVWGELGAALVGRSGSPPDLRASLLQARGTVALTAGRYQQAAQLLGGLAALQERALAPDDPARAETLTALAAVALARGEQGEALELMRRSLELRRRAFGNDHPRVAASLNNLGAALVGSGAHDEALATFAEALAIKERLLGRDHPDVGTSVNNLGEVLRLVGRPAEAVPLFERALAVWSAALGEDHPWVAEALDGRGAALRDLGRYSAAAADHRRALALREARFGTSHPRLAYSLTGLGRALLGVGAAAAARPHLERALALRSDAEADPAEIAESRFALAAALWESGDRRQARALARAAHETYSALGAGGARQAAEVADWLAAHSL
ncbi:MAG TPA: tetratricopeptide repeat protein, partial [Thermoanaerobaculia bacterium]|nr:tetratricopeptide repeat protein [Thermoanaerobaculia bacterium]